jgi:hypothetical protein
MYEKEVYYFPVASAKYGMIGPIPVMILPYSTNEYAYAKKYTIFGMLISDSPLLKLNFLFIYLIPRFLFIFNLNHMSNKQKILITVGTTEF